MTKVLVTLTCLFACATLGAALALFAGWPLAILSGVVAFLFTQHMSAAYARRGDRRKTARDIGALRKLTMEFDQQLTATSRRMDEITGQAEARSDAQGRKIVAELQVLESLMREFAGKISRTARAQQGEISPASVMQTGRRQGTAGAYVASIGAPGDMLEIIRSSLEENRVDLYLQPIVSLPQRKLRYYEALSRLRAEDGSVIMPAQYIKVAAPAGLMSVVDNLLLFRCVQVVRRLTARTREIGIFCNISGHTLADIEFFPQFLDYMQANRDLAGQIIFEFAQSAVLKAGDAGERNLRRLSEMGFSLSMDHVETLALDFLRLKALGFSHIKVHAAMLTRGMEGANAAVAAEDFKKLLSRHGVNLIAERVEDEKTVVQLLDYSVDYAQGFLFGEPRAVREEAQRSPETATGAVLPLPKRVKAFLLTPERPHAIRLRHEPSPVPPRLIAGLSELAPAYDALICDVWGVIHDGHKAHPAAAEALARFRQNHGPVVLLTNAPRLTSEVAAQCAAYGVPPDCYDAIVSSGGAAHDELARRSAGASASAGATNNKRVLPLYYIGPDKDLAVMDGLGLVRTGIAEAALAMCTGLVDDMTETPADYADRLAAMRARNLTMICANPDLVVHRGAKLCYCAGALAKDYEKLGGAVIYYGKPHRPIYDAALAAAAACRPGFKKALAVGDGLFTDILGANRAGLDVLFIADGVHGEEVEPYNAEHLGKLFAKTGVTALAASRRLEW